MRRIIPFPLSGLNEYIPVDQDPLPDRTPVPWESEYDHVGEGPITKGE